MLKFKKLAVMLVAMTVITTSTISLNKVQAFAKTEEIVTYSSIESVDSRFNKMKVVANGKFIEDPHNNNNTLFLSTDGSFIKSGLEQGGAYYFASMYWPSAYKCTIEIEDDGKLDGKAKIVSSLPKNTIKTSKVDNVMGYSAGGTIGMEGNKPVGSINGSVNVSQSISYDQPNFNTINTNSSSHKASWDVRFSGTDECYDRDSKNITYGNQMFMKSRLNNTGDKNLTSFDKLPTLVSGGFSPDFLVALSAPKDKKQSIVSINFKKQLDHYTLEWSGFNWFGYNFYNNTISSTYKFLIDWQKHTIKVLGEGKHVYDTRPIIPNEAIEYTDENGNVSAIL